MTEFKQVKKLNKNESPIYIIVQNGLLKPSQKAVPFADVKRITQNIRHRLS